MKEEKTKEKSMFDILKMVAPGTRLREGLDNILRARTGGLVVVGDSENVLNIVDGGFLINGDYSPARMYELAKMDGAIILSEDLKKILYANTLLIPNPSIQTKETGARHKTAERVAKQTNEIVVCISQRRNIISIYHKNQKHILRDSATIVTRANQALQTLEKYRTVLDSSLNNLSTLEFEDIVNLNDVSEVLQRYEMVMRVVDEINRYISELGDEGRLVSMQLDELFSNVEVDGLLIMEDYIKTTAENKLTLEQVKKNIQGLSNENLLDPSNIGKCLGYQCSPNNMDIQVTARGYRILNKVPRLPMTVVKNIIDKFNNFQNIINASVENLDDVDGIGEVRAKIIREGIKRIHEKNIWENLRR